MTQPTPQLIKWAQAEIGVLIHFDIEVFQPQWIHIQNGKLNPPPKLELFNPTELNTDLWIKTAKAAGATYAVLTAKHVTGFTLFPDALYQYSIDKTPYKLGKGDIVQDFINSCHKYQIKPGLYYSCEANSYLNIHRSSKNIPKYPSKEWDEFKTIVTRQLQLLWTKYGELFEIWFDGGLLEHGPDYLALLQKYQPNAVTFQGPDQHSHRIRWVGNERGLAPYPCWSTIYATESYDGTQEIGDKNKGDPEGTYWVPAETDVPLRYMNWFWIPNQESLVASPGLMMKWYYESVGRNSNLLIGMVIDNRGLIPETDVISLNEFGEHLKKRFSQPLGSTQGSGTQLDIVFDQNIEFNNIEIMENIDNGHQIREFVIEKSLDGITWVPILTGSAIGHKFLSWIEVQIAKQVRIKIQKKVGSPVISKFAIYKKIPLEDEFDD
jgi:alpha-L-fucosidase